VSRYQKGKTNLDLLKQETVSGQGISWISLHLTPDTHASNPPLSFFTGWMPFLPPNRQRQSTEGISHDLKHYINVINVTIIIIISFNHIDDCHQITAASTELNESTASDVDFAYVERLHLCAQSEQKRLEVGFSEDVIKRRLVLDSTPVTHAHAADTHSSLIIHCNTRSIGLATNTTFRKGKH